MNIRDEKFYYNDLTYFISERILECINEGIKSNWGNVYWPYPTKILNDSYSVEYKWEMHRVKQDHRWDVIGYAGPNESFEPSVEFHFLLKKGIALPGIPQFKTSVSNSSSKTVSLRFAAIPGERG